MKLAAQAALLELAAKSWQLEASNALLQLNILQTVVFSDHKVSPYLAQASEGGQTHTQCARDYRMPEVGVRRSAFVASSRAPSAGRRTPVSVSLGFLLWSSY
jgi:hypothetical protein